MCVGSLFERVAAFGQACLNIGEVIVGLVVDRDSQLAEGIDYIQKAHKSDDADREHDGGQDNDFYF
ncbi:hypothetical protein [Paenibacillus pabuli]|uniref:hypothetical protein n=1 Tax=Paenibacillus pabuli TaxID=1472 RepID=UPI003CE8396A